MLFFSAARGRGLCAADLPSNKTVRKKAMELSKMKIDKIKPVIQKAVEDHSACFALDHCKRIDDWLAVIVHFMNETNDSWVMQSRPIGFVKCKKDQKTGAEIYNCLLDIAQELGINRYDLPMNAAISDEGSNAVKAIQPNFYICKFLLIFADKANKRF